MTLGQEFFSGHGAAGVRYGIERVKGTCCRG